MPAEKKVRKAKPSKPAPEPPIVWERADPAALAAFDPASKTCTMNCGKHAHDPRSYKELKFMCDDCDCHEPKGTQFMLTERPQEQAPGFDPVAIERAALKGQVSGLVSLLEERDAENDTLRELLARTLDYYTESCFPEDLLIEVKAALKTEAEQD